MYTPAFRLGLMKTGIKSFIILLSLTWLKLGLMVLSLKPFIFVVLFAIGEKKSFYVSQN